MKGKLTKLSLYGFQVDNKYDWHNFVRNRNGAFNELCKKLINQNIEWEEDSQGKVIMVKKYETANKPKSTSNKKIKLITSDDYQIFESEVNKFFELNNVISTQTFIKNNDLVAVCYYEVKQ
jgi:hypothetical protein